MEAFRFLFCILSAIVFSNGRMVAQVPYTPFPKDSLSWHIWGESYKEMAHPASLGIIGKDTIIDGKTYSQVAGYGGLSGIREENKRVYVYISEFGEHLLYDFNLEIGDTIFYNIGLFISWDRSDIGGYGHVEHYAVVIEKGTITLNNGSIRNTITLQTHGSWMFGSIQWIEGLGSTAMTGLLDPLVYTQALNATSIGLVCICESYNPYGCLLYNYCGNHPGILAMGCPCKPINDNIIENKQNKITVSPNPTSGQLRITNNELQIKQVELYGIVGNLIESIHVDNNELEINMQKLQSGIYFIRITTDKGITNQKIVKL